MERCISEGVPYQLSQTRFRGQEENIIKIKIGVIFIGHSVFCTLDPPIIEYYKGQRKKLMGTCLAANNSRDPHSEHNLPTSPDNLRTEIAQQLKETTLAPNIKSAEEFSFHQQSSLHRNHSAKTDSLSEASVKATESSKKIVRKEKKPESMPSQPSLKKVDLKDVTEVSSSNPNGSSVCQSQEEEQYSEQDTINEDSESAVETPHSRKDRSPEIDMIGKGLTEDDNKMISLTLASNQPIRLNEIKLKNTSTYTGEWLQGKRHGQGILRWPDGSVYKGAWVNNCSQGQGKLTYSDGGTYEGQFHQNKAHGKGVFTYTNGSRYEGDWKDDEPEGMGIIEWPDGQRYDGQWQGGKKHGIGTITFKDGSFYKGEFSNNQIHGKGYYYWKDLKEYQGEWEHNQMHGKGKITWQNGQSYEGGFSAGKFQGRGLMTYADGSRAEGNWEKGRKHGYFNQTDPAGKLTQVQWHMGKRAKPLIEYNRRDAKRLKQQQSKTTSSQQL